jgi:hypothetical protein
VNQEATLVDCAQFEGIVHEIDRPGTEGFAFREAALAHAESCSRCARLMTQVESLDLGLRAFASHEAERQAPAHVGNELMEEFRRTKAAASRRRFRSQVVALATAAAVLLALGVSLRHRLMTGPSPAPARDLAGNHPSPAAPAGSAEPATTAARPDSEDSLTADNLASESADATAFVPLPYADDPSAADGGAVVRVVLSRPALASLGLPVTDMGATDRIPADIIVSEDGAPQAIRLVSQSSLDD